MDGHQKKVQVNSCVICLAPAEAVLFGANGAEIKRKTMIILQELLGHKGWTPTTKKGKEKSQGQSEPPRLQFCFPHLSMVNDYLKLKEKITQVFLKSLVDEDEGFKGPDQDKDDTLWIRETSRAGEHEQIKNAINCFPNHSNSSQF